MSRTVAGSNDVCRCHAGVACVEVVVRLHAVELARVHRIDNQRAIDRLLWWANQHAAAQGYGTDRAEARR